MPPHRHNDLPPHPNTYGDKTSPETVLAHMRQEEHVAGVYYDPIAAVNRNLLRVGWLLTRSGTRSPAWEPSS